MALFGFGRDPTRGYCHFFLGGQLETNEAPEATVLRELNEEATLQGTILFLIPEAAGTNHFTYLVDIGDQHPKLGMDPEEAHYPQDHRHLQKLIWLDLHEAGNFTSIDRQYFKSLLLECQRRQYNPQWTRLVAGLIDH